MEKDSLHPVTTSEMWDFFSLGKRQAWVTLLCGKNLK
jgi:hypothetical protein